MGLKAMPNYDPTKFVGSSTTPTLYRMTLPKEGEVYVKCGADILINGLKTDLRAEAQCPVCGTITRFQVDNRRVKDLAPKDPTLHVVELVLGQGRLGIECESTHIFEKKDCLTKWLSVHAGKPGLTTSLPEYMDSLNRRRAVGATKEYHRLELPSILSNRMSLRWERV